MAHPKQQDSIRYVTDIVNLSVDLDEVITRESSQPITRALSRGKEEYFDLVYRRLSVDFGDAPTVLWMLDLIEAQLAALARLQSVTPAPPVIPDSAHPGASALDG